MVNSHSSDGSFTVVVSGDVTVDWNLARDPLVFDSDEGADTRVSWQRGGAALLADLVEKVASTLTPAACPPVVVCTVEAPVEPIPPGNHGMNHSYAIWAPFDRDAGDKGRDKAWRAVSLLGVDPARSDTGVRAAWAELESVLPTADLVVLDDANLGFRDRSEANLWRRTVAERRPWVVLKQARPVTKGPLWEHLVAEVPERLVVILRIDNLRGQQVQISRELSWERTAQDLLWELLHKPAVSALSRVAYVVVSFGPAGAALVSGSRGGTVEPSCTLFFDPQFAEGMWGAGNPGLVMGGVSCLTAAVVREILRRPEAPDVGAGIQAGVAAQRRLHVEGYEERGPGRMELGFPLSLTVEEMCAAHMPLQEVEVPDPAASDRYWTILRQRCTGDLAAKAAEIVTDGPKVALQGVPLGQFGKLVTADRSEIEAFRSVGGLIAEYTASSQASPLSIGVFGPPGAGKSFGVKQVARAAARGKLADEPLEFNLAQLGSPDELADALHLVRDQALEGRIPLVFWDEFDTTLDGEPLGWLRYFLAPMQDGKFRQGQLVHPIGRAIFVFAGGTCARLEEFATKMQSDSGRAAKGPDFVSRLRGYVNVLGPNPHGDDDPFHLIRRAILLRSILERTASRLFEHGTLRMDPGVLRAFLETTTYRHGARSLEAIVAMSRLSGKQVYERSSLPPEPQLDLHVDAQDFLAQVQRIDLEGDLLEQLARAAHTVFCADLEADGYVYGVPGDGRVVDIRHTGYCLGIHGVTRKVSDSLVPYDALPEFKREQNRCYVQSIPAKLARVGCVMVPCRDGLPSFAFTEQEVERLASAEHERWMRDLGPGWRYGKPSDKPHRISDAYLPWEHLPEKQKNKDRNLVCQIPTILHEAGYAVVRAGQGEQGGP